MKQSNTHIMNEHIAFMGEFMTNMNTLTTKLLRDLREQYYISNEQSSVLMMLSHKRALTLTEITLRQGVNKAAVSRRVKKLVELDLVKWVNMNYEHDKRLKYIALTEKGKEYVEASRHLVAELATKMLSDIPVDQLVETRQVLEKINQRMASQFKHL
ncbi:MarR family winged helix-turn-helix transcriptional regulator [Staphylococcus canis]|uniref:Winged helix-turn-helix transcriptional regulator n=1 Tax=Staphylococcus canis TaxID=2724942 RepID=A0ABS0T8L3_9STAP|nr:MarR family winged helix-turn-helix transcriptional regulator [Staphylococcus canis]MBI5974301.1 winged helix-turn-helix transcriptional regulator [Staphylococcus canis]